MAGFLTITTTVPGLDVLTQIEGITIVDLAPPASPVGAGTGAVCVVGEFERGSFNSVTEVTSGTDLEAQFGGLGYTYDGQVGQYPVAVKSAQSADLWNGNGFIGLRNKRFARLLCVRVDNSAGSVAINRRAKVVGGSPTFALSPSSTLRLSLNGAPVVTATFTGTRGQIVGVGAVYPTGFVGGEFLGLRIDDAPEVLVQFQAGDQSLAQVIARINNTLALDVAYDAAGQLGLRSPSFGYDSSVQISSGNAQATLGLPAAEVVEEWQLTVNNTTAGAYEVELLVTIDGVTQTYTAEYTLGGAETLTQHRDILLNAWQALGPAGVDIAALGAAQIEVKGLPGFNANISITSPPPVEPAPGDVTAAQSAPPTFVKANGTGNCANLAFVTFAEVKAVVEPLGVFVDLTPAGLLRIANTSASPTASIQVDAASTAAAMLGLPVGTVYTAAQGVASAIPAGTRVLDATTGAHWVLIEDVAVPATLTATLSAKVRPGRDDDTTPVAAAGDLSSIVDSLDDSFGVTNAAPVSRLTAAQMDVRYLTAIEATIDVSGLAYETNIICSARSSETIMRALRSNVLEAAASGHRARKAIVSPPIGTSRAVALGSTGVGVGSVGRSERVFYAFPGLTTLIPEIRAQGSAGGVGFTDDGVVQVRSDLYYASVASILAPEENRGQDLASSAYGSMTALQLEDAYNRTVGGLGLSKQDYINFKAGGIIAPRYDRTAGVVFQSDVTSVNPAVQGNLVDAKRRFMGDFVIDSSADIARPYIKKLNTPLRRRALLTAHRTFLDGLLSRDDPEAQRIAGYDLLDQTTPSQRDLGIVVMLIKVKTLASMDYIQIRTEVGSTVEVTQVA